MRRGIGFHTVVSTGNQAVLSAADWIEAVAALDGVRSIALFLEEDGDGADLARALAGCAEREIGVAVLKVGSSEAGARAAGAHTGAVAGDQRVFSALLEEAGAATGPRPAGAAGAGALPGRSRDGARADGGVAVLTCSGGDSGLAADLAEREGLAPPRAGAGDPEGPRPSCSRRRRPSATPSTTPRCSGTSPRGSHGSPRRSARTRGSASCCFSSTSPRGCPPPPGPAGTRCARSLVAGAERAGADPLLASTVPDLLPERSALELAERGIAALAGLSEAIRCASALRAPRPSPQRLREIAAAAARRRGDGDGDWLGEAESKAAPRRGRDPGAAVRRRRRRRRRRRPRRRARRPGRDQALGPGAAAQERGRGPGPRPRGGRRGPRRLRAPPLPARGGGREPPGRGDGGAARPS